MSFFGWMTKGHCDVTLLDSMTALVELGVVVFVIYLILEWRKR
jgi:hypothetical protein